MSFDTCFAENQLKDYALGILADEDSGEVERHLAVCEHCDSAVATFDGSADSLIRTLRLKPEPADEPSWIERLATEPCSNSIPEVEETPRDPAPEDPLVVGDYRLQQVIGRGGMSVVFSASHQRLGREVAFKVLRQPALAGRRAIDRFSREMKSIGGLSHPAIVQATDAGEHEGVQYLVMERVDGIDLSRLLYQTGPLQVSEACRLVCEVADALVHAHEAGIIHRDIKPSNVMLDQHGRVKLLDFGLARLTETAGEVTQQTTVGQLLGTLDYMAPEQANGDPVDGRADVYSLGATLFRLLTGKPPFGRSAEMPLLEFVRRMGTEEAPPITELRTDIPEELATVIANSLASDVTRRIKSAAELRDSLEPFARDADLLPLAAEASGGQQPFDSATATVASEVYEAVGHMFPRRATTVPPKQNATNRGNRFGPWWLALIAMALLGPLVYFGVTILLTTPEGTVQIESEVDDVRVELVHEKEGATKLRVNRNGKETEVLVGRYRVHIVGESDGLEVTPRSIVVKRGETVVARVFRKKTPDKQPGDRKEPSIKVYSVKSQVSEVAKTLEALMPGRVVNEDTRRRTLHIKATPAEHEEIAELIRKLEPPVAPDAGTVSVFPMSQLDPQAAAQLLRATLGIEVDSPLIQVDPSGKRLICRGTAAQLEQIRQVLGQLGEVTSTRRTGGTSRDPANGAAIDKSPLVAAYKVVQLKMDLDRALGTFGENHSKVHELKSQLRVAEQLASGVPTEPVYKGKPLSHWEGILKYETLGSEKVTAASAVQELIESAPLEKQIELTARCLAVQMDSMISPKIWTQVRWASLIKAARQGSDADWTVEKRLRKHADNPVIQKELIRCLNDEELRDGAVYILAAARKHLRENPGLWAAALKVAGDSRDKLSPTAQLCLGFALPQSEAAKAMLEISKRSDKSDSLATIVEIIEACNLPVSRSEVLRIAGQAIAHGWDPTDLQESNTIAPILARKLATERTEQELQDLETFLSPSLDSIEASLKDQSLATRPPYEVFPHLDWLQPMIAEGKIGGPVEERLSRVLESVLKRYRDWSGRSTSIDMHMARATNTLLLAIIQLTGRLPEHARAAVGSKLPPALVSYRSARSPSGGWLPQGIGLLYPVETLEACEALAARFGSQRRQPRHYVEEPLIAWAAVISGEVRLPTYESQLLGYAGGQSKWVRTLLSSIKAYPRFCENFLRWIDASPSDEVRIRRGALLLGSSPHERLLQYVETGTASSNGGSFSLATVLIGAWERSTWLHSSDTERLAKIAGSRPGHFYPLNQLKGQPSLRKHCLPSAIDFLTRLVDQRDRLLADVGELETSETASEMESIRRHAIRTAVEIIAESNQRTPGTRRLLTKLKAQVEDGTLTCFSEQTTSGGDTAIESGDAAESGERETHREQIRRLINEVLAKSE